MTCAGGKPTFRLLDSNVGWDPDYGSPPQKPSATVNLTGFCSPEGVMLAQVDPGAIDPAKLFAYLLPTRLARGCGACEWFLLTKAPPASLLLHRDGCNECWSSLLEEYDANHSFADGVALATWRDCIAVADARLGLVLVWTHKGKRLLSKIAVEKPEAMAFTASGTLLIVSQESRVIMQYSRGGDFQGPWAAKLPQPKTNEGGNAAKSSVASFAIDVAATLWIVLRSGDSFTLWSSKRGSADFSQQTDASALAAAFPPSGLAALSDDGFCFDENAKHGLDVTTCFSWYGRHVPSCEIKPYGPPGRKAQGQLITLPIDSGIPRCEWHRVRLDADVPSGTSLQVSLATTETLSAAELGDSERDAGWSQFPAGAPHFSDWTSGPPGSTDFLIQQPPGRYMYFRLRLKGNGVLSPIVRRAQIDFPRVTSLERLPDVYRETAKAEDFTKRFLSLFDASIADMDSLIERYPALLTVAGVPDQVLPWLAGFFDVGFDATWDSAKRRAILNAIPQLYKLRGTREALALAIQTIFGFKPDIQETSSVGPWGSIADRKTLRAERCSLPSRQLNTQRNVQLGVSRLFGKNATRFRLGHSSLGRTPIRSFGDPDQDPFSSRAFRLQIALPPFQGDSPEQRQRLRNLVEAQKPAHTIASIRFGGAGFLLGMWSAVGVDTAFAPLAGPVLGAKGNIRLNRMSVLACGVSGRSGTIGLGRNSIVGLQTIAG